MKESIKILIVDDEPQQLETIVSAFEEFDEEYIIYRAFNGKIALRIVEKEKPNLVITDWDMPEMDGIELTKAMKTNQQTRDIPVIMCSGVMISSHNLHTALEAGAVDYIRKPLDKIELIARTRSMLKLSDSLQQVKALNAEKDKFFGIVAHDLRNPFQALLGFSKLLNTNYDNYDDNKRKHFINSLEISAQSAHNFLENLLTWSRAQRGILPFYPGMFDLNALIEAISTSGPILDLTEGKNIKISFNLEKNISVFADREMIGSVLKNFLSNALKYSHPETEVAIHTQVHASTLLLSVQDWGVGISEENLDKLFRIDINFSTPGTNKERGSGLGLIICQEFAQKNNGTISVESKEGEGSTFYLSLPLSGQEQ